MSAERPHRAGRRYPTDEQLLAYRATTPEQRLRWLQAMWRFT